MSLQDKKKKKYPLTSTRSTTRVRTININHLGGNLVEERTPA